LSGKVSPVQSRRLARTLRRWREKAGYSVERAAAELLCGAGTVSRMETGGSVQPLRVKTALEMYGAPPKVVADMVAAAQNRHRRGVLRRPYYDFVSATFAEYLDLENEAGALACYQFDVVSGLLQTEDYARALIAGAGEDIVRPDDMDKFLQLRMGRKQRLSGDDPMGLRVILGEAALHTEIGGPDVLGGQLGHLVDLAESAPNIDIRVLPFTAGAHPAVSCNFTVVSFAGTGDAAEPEIIYTENGVAFVLQDDSDEVARYQRIYNRVWGMTADADASVAMMRQARAKLMT
jgi:transcriptional regulator with XRE-family HTH domain